MPDEEKKIEGEDLNDQKNGQGDQEGQQKEDPKNPPSGNAPEKDTYTKEEVEAMKKEMAANFERGVQKKFQDEKLKDVVIDSIGKIARDQSYLVELHEDNPKAAKLILDKYYDGMSIDQFKDSIGFEEDLSDPVVAQKMIERKANEKFEQHLINTETTAFIAKLNMSPEKKEEFMEALDERRGLKTFSSKTIQDHLLKARKEVSNGLDEEAKKLEKDKKIAETHSSGSGDSNKSSGANPQDDIRKRNSEYNKKFLKQQGIL